MLQVLTCSLSVVVFVLLVAPQTPLGRWTMRCCVTEPLAMWRRRGWFWIVITLLTVLVMLNPTAMQIGLTPEAVEVAVSVFASFDMGLLAEMVLGASLALPLLAWFRRRDCLSTPKAADETA